MNEKNTNKQNVLTQATILMAAGIITRIIGLLYRSPVTSIIGDLGNGYYSIAVNIYTMVLLISSYSIPLAVSKVVSARLALKEYKNAHRVFLCALIYVLIVGGIASLLTFFCAGILVGSSQINAAPVLQVLAPTIFFSGFLGVFRGYFQAHGTMVPTSVSQIVEQVANAIVSIGAAILFIRLFAGNHPDRKPVFGAMGSAAGIGAGVLIGLLFMLMVYMANRSFFRKRTERDRTGHVESYREIFRIIFLMVTPVILATFIYNCSTIVDQNIFLRIMDHRGMNPEQAAAYYGVFSGKYWVLINVPIALANSMSTAMIPAVSSNYALGNMEKCGRHIREAIQFVMLISIPAAVGIGVMARPLMEVMFPQRETIDMAVSILHMGCISVVFYALSTVTNGVIQGIGKVNIPLRNTAVSLILHVGVLMTLLHFTDMTLSALVLATIFYSFLMCLLNNLAVRKHLQYRQELRRTFLIPGICALIMGAVCYGVYIGLYYLLLLFAARFLPVRLLILIAMGVAILAAIAVYFVLILKFHGVTEEELRNFPKGSALVRLAGKFGLL